MKTQNQGLGLAISKSHLKEITTEVKETLALGYIIIPGKAFSSAELWNIQRRTKSALSRRKYV